MGLKTQLRPELSWAPEGGLRRPHLEFRRPPPDRGPPCSLMAGRSPAGIPPASGKVLPPAQRAGTWEPERDPRRQFSQDSEVETSAAPGWHVPEDRRHPCCWRPTGPGAPFSPSPAGGGPEWLRRRAHSPQPWVHKHGAPRVGETMGWRKPPEGREQGAGAGPASASP